AKISGKVKKLKNREDVAKILSTLGFAVDSIAEKSDKKGNKFYETTTSIDFTLVDAEKKNTTRTPGAPFTTSTLQQEASRKLGMGVAQTMSVAQNLYQNGFITYMRTDSVNLSSLAMDACKAYIDTTFGKEYSITGGRKYKTKQANAQEAHEAIRPAYIDKTPENIGLEGNDIRLYRLIWERTVASQMKEAEIETTTFTFSPTIASDQEWISKGEVIKFPGFMKLYVEGTDEETEEGAGPATLPDMKKGEVAQAKKLLASQTFSRPPSRYTEAMLVKKLESEGIGRPSTYAPTIGTIVDRGYVEKIDKKLAPTDIAFTVNDFLETRFPEIMDYKFTAKVEEEFDVIATGKLEWTDMLDTFYKKFSTYLIAAMEEKGKVQEKVGKACPKCESDLVYKFSKNGRFIGCSNYPTCDYLENITNPEQESKLDELRAEHEGKPCPAGGTIVVKTGRFGPFLASSLYPEVKWIGKIQDKKTVELEEKYGGGTCDKCGAGIMHVKGSRRGPFLACSAYPECKNAKNLPKEDEL
ncbi:MAG: DNA topoisomerase, partial [Candidatus Gracilibacteria bacterium]|nr:DNA topoisomerase [Candidatus Gracilibacteria bacterium]